MVNQAYDNNSISQLKGAERVRKRPEALLGSNGIDGAKHGVYEILGNASDEHLSGFGDTLDMELYEDGSISIRDYGRGVPLGWNEKEGNWNYFLIYEELYAGSKYGDQENQEYLKTITDWSNFKPTDVSYMFKIGLNGVGASATQYTSEYFTVISYRDGKSSRMDYKKGIHVRDSLLVEPTTEPNGTYVKWKPDAEVFSDVNIDEKWLENLAKTMAFVNGFTVNFKTPKKEKVFPASTIYDEMIKDTGVCVLGKNFTHTEDQAGDICVCFCDVAIGKEGGGNDFYNNRIGVRGGVHQDAVSAAQSVFLSEIFKKEGLKVTVSDYARKLSFIVSTLSNKVSYKGQTKDSLDNYYVYECIYNCIMSTLKTEYAKGTEWIVRYVDQVRQNIQNRIAVAELSKNIKEIAKSSKVGKASEKFRPCETYNKKPEETEFWIMEGDSAGSSFKNARDPKYQCFLTIRGKSLNVFKASIEKLLKNKEISDMISILGCGVDLGIEGYETFDISKLRVGKIIFASDADIDGMHIRMLLFLIFYKLFPELLNKGYVYVAETPLHVLNLKDNTSVYCIDDAERDAKIAEIGRANIKSIDRFKGLGEVNADQLWETTINPETRHLVQIKTDPNDTEIYDVIECLFGKSTDRRKKAILGSMLGSDYDSLITSIEETINDIESLQLSDVEYSDIEMGA